MELQRLLPEIRKLPREQMYLKFTALPGDEFLIAQLPPDRRIF
jgi:hypothetical protein